MTATDWRIFYFAATCRCSWQGEYEAALKLGIHIPCRNTTVRKHMKRVEKSPRYKKAIKWLL